MASKRMKTEQAVRDELGVIALAQRFASSLQSGINDVRAKNGMAPLDEDDRLLPVLIEALRDCVTHSEIDEAARELYGDRFEGFSICKAHKEAVARARQKKGLAAE